MAVKFSKVLNQGQDILMIDSHLIPGYFISSNGLCHVGGHENILNEKIRLLLWWMMLNEH